MRTEPAFERASEQMLRRTRAAFLPTTDGSVCDTRPVRDGAVGEQHGLCTPRAVDVGFVEVHPTGLFPRDLDEVASAINGGMGPSGVAYDGGGTVLLKSRNKHGVPTAFNFGLGVWPHERGSVAVRKDVIVLGERCRSEPQNLTPDAAREVGYRPDRTVVMGGKRPFRCPGTNQVATRLSVRNLYFAYPSLAAIQVAKSAGLVVQDCVIYGVKSDVSDAPVLVPYAANGIEARGAAGSTRDLSGEFRVEDSVIWRRPQTAEFCAFDAGIMVQRASMVAVIRRNEVTGFGYVGIGIDQNSDTCSVQDNRIAWCGFGDLELSGGIATRCTTHSISIARNQIECGAIDSPQCSTSGINLDGSSNVWVASNTVFGSGASVGVRLANASSECVLHGNRLLNLLATRMQVHVGQGCRGNLLVGNEYGGVARSGTAGALVQGEDNQLIGERFSGAYLGYQLPCVWLTKTSSSNRISQLKFEERSQWVACTQVRDEGVINNVLGPENRTHP